MDSPCPRCRQAYWFGGFIQCRLEPFRVMSKQQREIVEWLHAEMAWQCPGFVPHESKRNWGLFNGAAG